MASSRDRELLTECQCCRHFDHDAELDQCSRCVACGEWCEECGTITLLHDSGLCEDCCHRAGCHCGEEDDEEEDDGERMCATCGESFNIEEDGDHLDVNGEPVCGRCNEDEDDDDSTASDQGRTSIESRV